MYKQSSNKCWNCSNNIQHFLIKTFLNRLSGRGVFFVIKKLGSALWKMHVKLINLQQISVLDTDSHLKFACNGFHCASVFDVLGRTYLARKEFPHRRRLALLDTLFYSPKIILVCAQNPLSLSLCFNNLC